MDATAARMEAPFKAYEDRLRARSDRFADLFLLICSGIGLLLATCYGTWSVAVGTSGLCLCAYYSVKHLLPASDLYQYVLSVVVGIFMAQFIYQMHGMFEMHFFAFIGSAFLIAHQNWRLQLPLAAVVLVHHAIFGYLQYMGVGGVYFTQLDFMPLGTFFIHGLLATFIFLLCGLWAHIFQRTGRSQITQSYRIGALQEANAQQQALLQLQADLTTLNARNKDINDSITYTQRLQRAILPDTRHLQEHFAASFVLNRPHSIVGGDFLWFHRIGTEILVACVDCTGHGVPGAFMSIIAIDLLNKIVREHGDRSPGAMLSLLDEELDRTIGAGSDEGVLDGMDMVLCRIDLIERKLRFAGAMNPLILSSPSGVSMFKGNGHGLGGTSVGAKKEFETHELAFHEGDMLYMFSDGCIHQFGGPRAKKMGTSGLLTLIKEVHSFPTDEQGARLAKAFDEWRGPLPQTDDALLVGLQLMPPGRAASGARAA